MVINNKRYNIDASELMASSGDELLYRKRTGEYFLYNADVKKILPLNYDDALSWGKDNLSSKKVNAIFYEPEFKSKKNVIVSLSGSAIKKLNNLAAKQQISKSQIVENLILKEEP